MRSSSNSRPKGIRRTNLRRRSNWEKNSQIVRDFRDVFFIAWLLAPTREGLGICRSLVRACRGPGPPALRGGRQGRTPGGKKTIQRSKIFIGGGNKPHHRWCHGLLPPRSGRVARGRTRRFRDEQNARRVG